MSKIVSKESEIQKTFIDFVSLYPRIKALTLHIPNGGYRNPIEAKNLRKQGVLPGVPDIFIAIPSKGYPGLWIEFKAGRNKLTELQSKMIDNLSSVGYMTSVCYSADDAIEVLRDYLGRFDNV